MAHGILQLKRKWDSARLEHSIFLSAASSPWLLGKCIYFVIQGNKNHLVKAFLLNGWEMS